MVSGDSDAGVGVPFVRALAIKLIILVNLFCIKSEALAIKGISYKK